MSTLIPVEIFQEVIIGWHCPDNPTIDGKIVSNFRCFKERFMSNFAPFIGEIIHINKKEYEVKKVTLYVDDTNCEKLTNDIKFAVDTNPAIYYVDYYDYLKATNKNLLDPNNRDISTLEVPDTFEKWKELLGLDEC